MAEAGFQKLIEEVERVERQRGLRAELPQRIHIKYRTSDGPCSVLDRAFIAAVENLDLSYPGYKVAVDGDYKGKRHLVFEAEW